MFPEAKVLVGLTIAWMVCVIALPVVALGVDVQDELTQMVFLGRSDDSEELNGRQPVWAALLPYIAARPLVGYGYETFWTQRHIEDVQMMARWHVRDAHSAYMNTMLGVGLVGTSLFAAMLLAAARRTVLAFRATGEPAFAFFFGLTAYFLAAGTLESNSAPPGLDILLLSTGISYLAFPVPAPAWSGTSAAVASRPLASAPSPVDWRTS